MRGTACVVLMAAVLVTGCAAKTTARLAQVGRTSTDIAHEIEEGFDVAYEESLLPTSDYRKALGVFLKFYAAMAAAADALEQGHTATWDIQIAHGLELVGELGEITSARFRDARPWIDALVASLRVLLLGIRAHPTAVLIGDPSPYLEVALAD